MVRVGGREAKRIKSVEMAVIRVDQYGLVGVLHIETGV